LIETKPNYGFEPISWYQSTLDELVSTMVTTLSKLPKDTPIAIEAVVQTGTLNQAKVHQIKAHDRVESLCVAQGHKVVSIQPQQRKAAKVTVPSEVEGDHARDACRIAVTYAYHSTRNKARRKN